ncbi:MAG: glycosyltransferase family 39 protein [Anaerolineae bacterium]
MLILLLATGLRFYKLDAQSFWNDEGNTARLVERPVRLIIEGAAGDVHPPGYYLLLRLWRALTGESEFALRSYSAFLGVLTVAIATSTAQRAAGWSAALGAALIAAVHPLAIYYSQEARMYAQLGLVSALTLWLGARLVDDGSHRSGKQQGASLTLFFALCIAAGLYTHYAYLFALLGLNLAFGLAWVSGTSRFRRRLGAWVLAHLIGGALFLPWAPIALRASGWQPPDLNAGAALPSLIQTLLVGITMPEQLPLSLFGAAVLLGLLALVVALRARSASKRFALWAALGMALTPPGVIAAAGIYRPAYLKFLMVSVAPLAVALGVCLKGRWDRRLSRPRWVLGAVLVTVLLHAQAASLGHLYTNPAYQRDDYRGLAALIRDEGQDGDAILLNAPNQWEVFTYYYEGPLPVYPAPYRPTEAEAEAWVASRVSRHREERLFVLFWGDGESDPEHHIERHLAQHAFKATDTWVTSIRLARYGAGTLSTRPSVNTTVTLGDAIRLKGYDYPAQAFTRGDIVPVTLFWTAVAAPEERLKVFVHLVDDDGLPVAQVDMEPQAGFAPTSDWAAGEDIVDRYGVWLPENLNPGDYTLKAGMYRLTGERLPITEEGRPLGDALQLGEIVVSEP